MLAKTNNPKFRKKLMQYLPKMTPSILKPLDQQEVKQLEKKYTYYITPEPMRKIKEYYKSQAQPPQDKGKEKEKQPTDKDKESHEKDKQKKKKATKPIIIRPQFDKPYDSDPSSSDSSDSDKDNNDPKPWKFRDRETSLPPPPSLSSTGTILKSSIKIPKPEICNGEGRFKIPSMFDKWMQDLIGYFEIHRISRNSEEAMKIAGHFLSHRPRELWQEGIQKTWNLGQYLVELRSMLIKSTYKDDLYAEFEKITQNVMGRTRPITEVAQDIRIAKTRLPWLTETQMYFQLKRAMEPDLRRRAGPFINQDMPWNTIVQILERFDSEMHKERREKRSNNNQTTTTRKPPTAPRYQTTNKKKFRKNNYNNYDSNQQNQGYNFQFKKRTPSKNANGQKRPFRRRSPQEIERMRQQKRCFICGQIGHMANDCPQKVRQINSHANNLTQKKPWTNNNKKPYQPPQKTNTINTHAQTLKPTTTNPKQKKKEMAYLLSDHLCIKTFIDSYPAKTLIDSQTVGSNFITSQYCQVHKIPTHELQIPVDIQQTLKGSRGKTNKYVEVELNIEGYKKKITAHVINMSNWDVILGMPTLKELGTIIDTKNNSCTMEPEKETIIKPEIWPDLIPSILSKKQISANANTMTQQSWKPLEEFPDVFNMEQQHYLPPLRQVNHDILLIDPNKSTKPANFQIAHAFMGQLREKLDKELAAGKIYPKPEARNPPTMFAIPKAPPKQDKARFLVDLRQRNDNTYKDYVPIPDIDAIINKVAQYKFISKIDVMDCYPNIRINPKHEQHNSFATSYGIFISKVILQGDCNAPATCHKLMHHIFEKEIGKIMYVYFDDIIIFSETEEQHIKDLRQVCTRLQENKFYADPIKCEFFTKVIHILGHTIENNKIIPTFEKVKKIEDWPTPTTQKQLQGFIGTVNYISRYIPQLANEAAPLTELCGNTKTWEWRDIHETSFQHVKKMCKEAKILTPLNYDSQRRIYLITDASDVGTGAWIGQEDEKGIIRPAMFHSRKFSPTQQNYSTHIKELLAIIDALQFFQAHLQGTYFTIITDNKGLTSFLDKENHTNKLARWKEIIQGFHCNIEYRPGSENYISDVLSRLTLTSSPHSKQQEQEILTEPTLESKLSLQTQNFKPSPTTISTKANSCRYTIPQTQEQNIQTQTETQSDPPVRSTKKRRPPTCSNCLQSGYYRTNCRNQHYSIQSIQNANTSRQLDYKLQRLIEEDQQSTSGRFLNMDKFSSISEQPGIP